VTPAVEAARKAGIAFTVHEYEGVEVGEGDYAVDVAAALGVEAARLFKTLLASVDGKLQVFVVPADRKLDLRAVGKANIVGEGGFVKLVAEREGPVRGVHLIGPHVTDLIAEGMLIFNWEALPEEVAALIHPHPTLSEVFGETALSLTGRSLHG
jgi:hypothetical protein